MYIRVTDHVSLEDDVSGQAHISRKGDNAAMKNVSFEMCACLETPV